MMRRCFGSTSLCLLAGLALPLVARAQPPVRAGTEFQVNVYTNDAQYQNHQRGPSIASGPDGDFVVSWASLGQDGNGFGIFARRFSSAGMVLVNELQVNSHTVSDQYRPAIAASASGAFVVVWQSYHEGGTYGVFARRFTSAGGSLLAGDLHVNTYTAGLQVRAAVANETNGDFVVVWMSDGQDGSGAGIFGQLFSSSGSHLDPEFQVNTHTLGNQDGPTVAADADGDFVVAWHGYVAGSDNDIFARRFSSSGMPLGAEFQVNVHTLGHQVYPAVAASASGDFVVAWDSFGQDGAQSGAFARRFSSAGAALGAELQVNIHTAYSQRVGGISAEPDGDFVVVWSSFGQDGDQEAVFGRRFSSAGAPLTAEFQVNTHTTNVQFSPSVATDAEGAFVVAWESYAQDDTGTGIFAQRFAGPITLDIDGNGPVQALSDGLLALRYFFGLRGAALTGAAIGSNCSRCDAASIEPYIAGLGLTLDIDGNGSTQALADGLLAVRYLFGLRDVALTGGAVGGGCTRCDAVAIEPYIASLVN